MVFISSKHEKQKEKGITIKVYVQGEPNIKSKTITLQETSVLQAYDKILKMFKEEKKQWK